MFQDKIKILHLADLHLGKEFSLDSIVSKDYSIRREEIWRTFENAINYASSAGVELVLLAGDNYENETMTISNLDRMAHIIGRYPDIQFFIIFGNHDHISSKSEYLKSIVPENVKIFDAQLEYVEYKNIRVYGYSWDRLEYYDIPFDYPLLDSSYFNILLLHATVSSSSNYLPINPRELEVHGFDYLALGHIHNPGQISESGYYAGSIEPMSFNNLDDHGGYLLEVKGSNKQVSFIKFATRNYHKPTVDLTDVMTTSMAADLVTEELSSAHGHDYIELRLVGRKSKYIDIEELGMILTNKYDNIRIINDTREDIDIDAIINENKDNIVGKYFQEIYNNYEGKELKTLQDIGIVSMVAEDKLED